MSEELEPSQAVPIIMPIGSLKIPSNTPKKEGLLSTQPQSPKGRVVRFLRSRLQILNWIGQYNAEWGVNDLIAGVTLGLTIIPESIACALLAGLPARYGLCSALIGPFIYLFFGSINNVIIGPTSLVALVSVQFTVGKPIEFAFLLTFLSGIVQILMGSFRLGFIFEFISIPVIKAFSSATAILVIESQIKVLLGIKYLVAGMLDSVKMLSSRIHEANFGDLLMGAFAIGFLIALDQLEKISNRKSIGKAMRVFCRYLSFSRNTLIVLITGGVAYFWMKADDNVKLPFTLSQNALSGLPNFTFPSLSVSTPEKSYSVWDILAELNIGIIVIPIVGVLTNVSIGKLTPKGLVESDQELLTVGLCNVFGSCVQSMPTSGAFSRYAISSACGLKTPMANLYTGIIVLLALSYISPYFNYIPESTLAAILMCSIFTLLDFKLPRRLWNESKRDFSIWVLCFTVSIFFGVEVGLFVSIIITILHLLFLWARPNIVVEVKEIDGIQYLSVTPESGIYFPAITHLREKVLKYCERYNYSFPVVITGTKISGIDYTAGQGISRLSEDLCQNDGHQKPTLILYRMQSDQLKLIDTRDNLLICNNEQHLYQCLFKLQQCENDDVSLVAVKVLDVDSI